MRRIGRVTVLCLAMGLAGLWMALLSVPALTEAARQGGGDGEPGLLFYLSGENGFVADYAAGDPNPAALEDIEIIEDGAFGKGFRCPHFTQIFGYPAAGNLYAQRGTVSFFWRARDPIGSTPFPIFQASYADHSSIDMAWMRIDFNGEGFDGFVTDASLARARASHWTENLPQAEQWVHLALGWDETQGVRLYVDGRLAGRQDVQAVFYAGLDKFGAHSDVIGPQDVVTMEQFMRGGDIDEIRIYDQMLSDGDVARLAVGEEPEGVGPVVRDLSDPAYREEWRLRYGWNRPQDPPPYLQAALTKVRKVEIHEAYDLKQWFWKANDGIRETTWPGVHNRSRLPGRDDYFPRPDWNCYPGSGKTVTFTLPEAPWNHVEISGSAYGRMSWLRYDLGRQQDAEEELFRRPAGQERTYHRLGESRHAGKLRFENDVQETPIGQLGVYHVSAGSGPPGTVRLSYTLSGQVEPDNRTLDGLVRYIDGRFMPDERTVMVALPAGAPANAKRSHVETPLPLIHILVPFEFRWETGKGVTTDISTLQEQRVTMAQADSAVGGYSSKFSYTWENLNGGLDGIELELPALEVAPTHGAYFPLNVQLKDPLWPDRNLIDFSFSVKPGERRTIWMDSRDRILPDGYPLYVTLAGAGGDFGWEALEGARLHLVFKDRKEAVREHEADRWVQVKDQQGNMVQWHSNKKTLRMYERFGRDIADLFKVNPDHEKGRFYWSYKNPEQGWPAFVQPKSPEEVPDWAFRQVELIRQLRHFVNWWIDHRQIENQGFGGGLSDDSDLTHLWVGAALMGIDPPKLTRSVEDLLEAIYNDGMFTDGLNAIMTDQLHTYEEGINVQPQVMQLKYGDPKTVGRMMETSRALERITGFDRFGHRHIRSSYFSGSLISEDWVWARAKLNFYSHLILHPALVLVEYNGNPTARKLMLELADGLLAHRKLGPDGRFYLPGEILYPSGEEVGSGFSADVANLFWAAWRWTGDDQYLLPILDSTMAGNEFDMVRYLGSNVIDQLDNRKSWGHRILQTLVGGRMGTLQPEPQTLSWSPPRRTRTDFFRYVAWQVTGEKRFLEDAFADQIQHGHQHIPMFTEDHWWSDMVGLPTQQLQRSRLGGVAAFRMQTYPGHVVSWRFEGLASAESVAILVREGTPENVRIVAFNLEREAVRAVMTAWDMEPGEWEIRMGVDESGDDGIDRVTRQEVVELERTGELSLELEPRVSTVIELKLMRLGKPMWERPDLGIGRDDVQVEEGRVRVTVHSLGSVGAPSSEVALLDPDGNLVTRAAVPSLEAPLDLLPRTATVVLAAPPGRNLAGWEVVVDPDRTLREITVVNNRVVLE